MEAEKLAMIGYHYTSWSNWLKIRRDGLQPYHILPRDEIGQYFPNGFDGVWLWTREMEGKAHAGSVIYQVSTKNEFRVAVLKVYVPDTNVLQYEGRLVLTYHDGTIGDTRYHDREEAFFSTDIIPPKYIELVGDYDLIDLLCKPKQIKRKSLRELIPA
jgi:hypothetical protein